MHFDAGVNHGVGTAARILQEVLGVAIDGEIGPFTLGSARTADPRDSLARYAAEELVEREIPVIVWPAPLGAGRGDEYEAHDPALAGELDRAGVRVLIGSGGRRDARELRFLAALAVGHGMEREAALAAITTAPAQVFDSGRELGTLAPGRSADVLVFDGDPLDTSAALRFVIARGEVVVQ
jgi:imidazolonepropionase-like amidohydrolase